MIKIRKTRYWDVDLHPNQYYLGYSIIGLKRKCKHLSGLKKEEILDFFKIVNDFEKSATKNFNATMFNWTCLMNDSYKKGKPPAQVHWHVRPRYKNKIKFQGITFEDGNFAHHYDKSREKFIPKKILIKIAQKLK